MKNNSKHFPVEKMAELFDISSSSYYYWLKRKPSVHDRRDRELLTEIKHVFKEKRKQFGSPRIYKELRWKAI